VLLRVAMYPLVQLPIDGALPRCRPLAERLGSRPSFRRSEGVCPE
jgi:hypothetical protein